MTTATKIDRKQELRELYRPPRTPVLVEVPPITFLIIDGSGDPNTSQEFQDATKTLYTASYVAKFALRRELNVDYTVMPLEGLWWADDMSAFATGDKSQWEWTLMIAQPDDLTEERFAGVVEQLRATPEVNALERLRRKRFSEGPCVQVMHIGAYSDEAPTIDALHTFAKHQALVTHGKHHEIYLNDPRRTAPERLKTVIRQPVELHAMVTL